MSASSASSDIKTSEAARSFRSGGIYLGANVANAALIFPLVPLLTRHLRPADYGITAAAFAISFAGCVTAVVQARPMPWRGARRAFVAPLREKHRTGD